jgi:methylated-DNA-[protein]-cysteine S-methyltransferase
MKKIKAQSDTPPLYYKAYYHSPLGTIQLQGDEAGLAKLVFLEKENTEQIQSIHPVLKNAVEQLAAYFNRELKTFDIKLNLIGTDYQQRVWDNLQKTEWSKTITYLDVSKRMLDINANRAVGNAIGKNPIAIIVPCHRVIGSDGKLVGYSGGLWRKEWLLEFEGALRYGKQSQLF